MVPTALWSEAAQTNGAAGMVSIMFMVFAVIFGLIQKKFNFSGWKESVISIVFIVLSFVIGANLPLILRQGSLELHHLCLHLLCSGPAHVAAQAAP